MTTFGSLSSKEAALKGSLALFVAPCANVVLSLTRLWTRQVGQPGIGKSVLLLYAMMRCIVQDRPVLVCDPIQGLLLINPASTSFRVLPWHASSLESCSDNTLVLIDCNGSTKASPDFLQNNRFHRVISGSSAPLHWDWLKKVPSPQFQFYVVAWPTMQDLRKIQSVHHTCCGASANIPGDLTGISKHALFKAEASLKVCQRSTLHTCPTSVLQSAT